jgi:hypothetical protein
LTDNILVLVAILFSCSVPVLAQFVSVPVHAHSPLSFLFHHVLVFSTHSTTWTWHTHTQGGHEHEENQALKLKNGTSGHDNDRSPLHPVEVILILDLMDILRVIRQKKNFA